MTTIKIIVTIINVMLLIALSDTASRKEDREQRIGLWLFVVLYTITTGMMWWQ